MSSRSPSPATSTSWTGRRSAWPIRPRRSARLRRGLGASRPDDGQPGDGDHDPRRARRTRSSTSAPRRRHSPHCAMRASTSPPWRTTTPPTTARSGLQDTLAAIRSSRFPVVGIGGDADQAYAAVQDDRERHEGRDHRRRPGARRDDSAATRPGRARRASPTPTTSRLLPSVRAAKAAGYVVVVYLHWGIEYTTCPDGDQRSLADALARAGASRGHRDARARAAGRRLAARRDVRRLRARQLPVVAVLRQQPGRQRRADPHVPRQPRRPGLLRAGAPGRPRRPGAGHRRRSGRGSMPSGPRPASAPVSRRRRRAGSGARRSRRPVRRSAHSQQHAPVPAGAAGRARSTRPPRRAP